jgi:hypothetical protein
MLGLKTKRYNADQIRCSCPIHGGEHKLSRSFDPVAFAAKLAFTDEVAELGITEEDAARLQIGFTRGKVYFPFRNDDGSISGFTGYADGQLKTPPQWIGTNVVKLKRA